MEKTDEIRLTQHSHGAGCGCKIAPADLEGILAQVRPSPPCAALLVGYASRDDAAVYDLGDGRALISTTDFFTPIVDDPYDFGRVASTNALSDVYAMGGTPLMALAILGWPVEKLGTAHAARVIEGARWACDRAGIPLAGGHSIDSPEPFFGLAITGQVAVANIKRNNTAKAGDVLLLTKPLGIGVLSTAQKRGLLLAQETDLARDVMLMPNTLGAELGGIDGVHALTDVTGFGLLGHLSEMCLGSGLKAKLRYANVPMIPAGQGYAKRGIYPDGAMRNWKNVSTHTEGIQGMEQLVMLSDPQTSGGLLIACNEALVDVIMAFAEGYETPASVIGSLHDADGSKLISVE